jgi:hypothetical protein
MTNQNITFQTNDKPKSKYICARRGVAGMGSLTDHGTQKSHGWQSRDYQITHNVGRGGYHFFQFRNVMMNKCRYTHHDHADTAIQYRLFHQTTFGFSAPNSRFANDIFRRRGRLLQIHDHVLQNMALTHQLQLASTASIFISVVGGCAVTAMFVPRGSSLILYYEHG